MDLETSRFALPSWWLNQPVSMVNRYRALCMPQLSTTTGEMQGTKAKAKRITLLRSLDHNDLFSHLSGRAINVASLVDRDGLAHVDGVDSDYDGVEGLYRYSAELKRQFVKAVVITSEPSPDEGSQVLTLPFNSPIPAQHGTAYMLDVSSRSRCGIEPHPGRNELRLPSSKHTQTGTSRCLIMPDGREVEEL